MTLVRTREVARTVGVDAATIRRWATDGLFKVERLTPTGQRLYDADYVAKFIAEMKVAALVKAATSESEVSVDDGDLTSTR